MFARALLPLLAATLLVAPLAQASQGGSATPSGALTIGDKAPPIRVGKWLRGKPLEGFEPGKVYVLDFWATWAAPIPSSAVTLTGLQKTYGGRVSFNGFAVYERAPKEKYIATVEKFVNGMGNKMGYAVAVDTLPKNGAMANAWMAAAGLNVLPTTFIIGKDGRIAWIGNPMDDALPKTLDAVLAGTHDARAARAAALKKSGAATAMQAAFTRVTAAYKRNDDASADAAMTNLVANYPETASMVLGVRFNRHLDKGRENEAHELLRTEWEGANLSADDLNTFAWELVTSKQIKTRDYPLAIAMATKGVELTEEADAAVIDTLAYALFYGGKVDEAIVWQEKAVKLTGGQDSGMVTALARYKKAMRG